LAILPYDVGALRSSMVDQVSALAAVLGEQSTTALEFNAPDLAQDVLASLRLEPAVQFACLYDTNGNIFVSYTTPDHLPPPPPVPDEGHAFTPDGNLEITRHIRQDQPIVGPIFLRASLHRPDGLVFCQILA